jgi:hypothetical protein
MNCRNVRILLPEYLQKRLSGPEDAAVSDHLLHCPDCAAEAEGLDILMHDLRLAEPAKPQEMYFINLLPRIHQRIDEGSGRKVPRWVHSFAMPLAAALMIVMALLNVVPSSRPGVVDELRGMLSQLKTDPQEAVEEVQATAGILSSPGDLVAQADTAVSDRDIVKALLTPGIRPAYTVEFDPRQYVDQLDNQSTNKLLAILDERIPVH